MMRSYRGTETGSTVSTVSAAISYRFSAKYTDAETCPSSGGSGLLYYGYRYYQPSTGRWLSRDPLEEEGGLSLCGFLSNNPITKIDGSGLAFYAVDGTWTDAQEQANPWQLYQETSEVPKRYWRGPKGAKGLLGEDVAAIAEEVYTQITDDFCEAKKACTNLTINLTGWSRGAIIAASVAQSLNVSGCWCLNKGRLTQHKPVHVNWVGLFDAVAMTKVGGPFPASVPSNVAHFDHAIKTDHAGRQKGFPTWHFRGSNERAFKNKDGTLTTHADNGMSVILGNHNDAYSWIKAQAIAAGVSF